MPFAGLNALLIKMSCDVSLPPITGHFPLVMDHRDCASLDTRGMPVAA
jgi:hypothetical protein